MVPLHIVGYDGTERGEDALALAMRLAPPHDARLLAAHVVPMPAERDRFAETVLERLEDEAAAVVTGVRERIGDEATPAPRVVFASSPAAGLHQVCSDEGAGLVTIGSTHRGPAGRVVAGTTAERLLSGSPCPVAIAPRAYAGVDGSFETVIAGYDGSDEAQLALEIAAGLAGRLGAALRVVAVAEPASRFISPEMAGAIVELDQSVREHAEHMAAEGVARVPAGLGAQGTVETGEPGAVLAALGRPESDLLVVGSRRYGPMRSVLAGTVGHHLARNATCPVLVVPRGVETDRAGELRREAGAGV